LTEKKANQDINPARTVFTKDAEKGFENIILMC
jgi:hypothetical protein